MYLRIFEILFIISGILFVSLLILKNFISSKIKDNLKISSFISFIAGILLLYIILAIILVFLENKIIYKIIMAIFALSPFIIGKLATFEKIKIYSFIQIIIAVISIICVYLF